MTTGRADRDASRHSVPGSRRSRHGPIGEPTTPGGGKSGWRRIEAGTIMSFRLIVGPPGPSRRPNARAPEGLARRRDQGACVRQVSSRSLRMTPSGWLSVVLAGVILALELCVPAVPLAAPRAASRSDPASPDPSSEGADRPRTSRWRWGRGPSAPRAGDRLDRPRATPRGCRSSPGPGRSPRPTGLVSPGGRPPSRRDSASPVAARPAAGSNRSAVSRSTRPPRHLGDPRPRISSHSAPRPTASASPTARPGACLHD